MPETLTIADQVRAIIIEHLGVLPEKATDDADLVDDLGADSLDLIELSVAAEEAFDIAIDDDKVDSWRTVGDVIKSVEALR